MSPRIIRNLLILAAAGACIGCASGMMSGGLYTDITAPGVLASQSSYTITPESDFESLAFVEGKASGVTILGLVATGDFGYGAAIENALKQAPNATRLIDITVDKKVKSFLGVYTKITTTVRGRAIRLKKSR
jgi:hypothetical protein